MKINIYDVIDGSVIYSHKQENNSIGKTLEKAAKERASLRHADLRKLDLSRLNLAYARFIGVDLSYSKLTGTDLSYADLSYSDLTRANLYRAYFTGIDLYYADLTRANLYNSDLTGANLACVNLTCAYLIGANFTEAHLTGAKYSEATLEKGLLQIYGKQWPIFIFDEHIKIGCEMHKTSEWEKLTDDEISCIDDDALAFWKANKEMILMLAKNHQSANDVPEVIFNTEDEK